MNRLAFKYRGDFVNSSGEHRDIQSLLDQKIYVPRLDELNDPYEKEYHDGIATLVNLSNYVKILNGEKVEWRNGKDDKIELLGRYCGIYSLSLSGTDGIPSNELLWAHYANSHKGFCIAYDWDEFCKYFEIQEKAMPIEVLYRDSPPVLFSESQEDRIRKVFGCKSQAWTYEQEARLVFTDISRVFSLNTYYCPSRLVKAIYLGLRISNESKELLLEYGRKNRVAIYQMKHPHNSYRFDAELVQE